MRWLTTPIRFLWDLAQRSSVSIDPGLRPRSGASALLLFFFLVFFVVGLILHLLGADLAAADRWLDAQGGWLDALGTLAFRALSGLIFLACVAMVGAGLVGFGGGSRRRGGDDEGIGLVGIGVAAVIGYFAWFGMVG